MESWTGGIRLEIGSMGLAGLHFIESQFMQWNGKGGFRYLESLRIQLRLDILYKICCYKSPTQRKLHLYKK
jgi:hypothetical protein